MPVNRIKMWLDVMANALEQWPKKDNCPPTEAAFVILRRHVPPDLRAKMASALPFLPTDDFDEAANIIRQAAKNLSRW